MGWSDAYLFAVIGQAIEPAEKKQAREERYRIAKVQDQKTPEEAKQGTQVKAGSSLAYAKSTVEENPNKNSKINGTIHEYSEAPIILQSQMDIRKRSDRMEVHFTEVSMIGQKNSIEIIARKNKSVEKITMNLALDSRNELAAMETYSIGYRVVQIASGRPSSKEDLEEFITWVAGSMREASKKTVMRRFGDTMVRLRIAVGSAGSGNITLTMEDGTA